MALVRTLVLAVVLTGPAFARKSTPPPAAAAAAVAPTIRTGVEKWRAGDYAAAVAVWTQFAAAGDADALFNMGQAYKLGRGVTADAAMARDYYRKAAAKGHLPAQANLGIALFQIGEKPEAIKWLKTAADRGEARAQYVLGIATFNGDGVPRSQAIGYGYLLRAQASGLPQAVTALGSVGPGLLPADRTAGEAIASSLAMGTGIPPALAAGAAPRLIPAGPPARASATPSVPAPMASATSSSAAGIIAPPLTTAITPRPTAMPSAAPAQTMASGAGFDQRTVPIIDRSSAAAPRSVVAAVDRPDSPATSRVGLPKPVRDPKSVQADAAAGALPRPTVTTIEIAPSSGTGPVTARSTVHDDAPPPARPSARITDTTPAYARSDAMSAPTRPLRLFEVADTAAKKPEGWRVQLGAFSTRKLADSAWADVKSTASPAKPLFATDGSVTKLQMGPFTTRDAAKVACSKLTAAGRACFVTQG